MATIGQFSVEGLIDIAFVGFVAFACLKSLLGDNSAQNRSRAVWRAELKALEESLRTLIGEASAASSNLDRRLLQRKRELETLLQKIESRHSGDSAAAKPPAKARSRAAAAAGTDDLPNESWLVGERSRDAAADSDSGSYRAVALEEYSEQHPDQWISGDSGEAELTAAKLRDLIDATDDTVSLSNQVSKYAALEQNKRSAAKRMHQLQAEQRQKELEAAQKAIEDETFRQTSIMDETTYRIARRLLKSGKEIHVVARKLELPVSEIRLLDRLMRQEQDLSKVAAQPEDDLPTQENRIPESRESTEAASLRSQISVEKIADASANRRPRSAGSALPDKVKANGADAHTPKPNEAKANALPQPAAAAAGKAADITEFLAESFGAVSRAEPALEANSARSLEQDIEREVALL